MTTKCLISVVHDPDGKLTKFSRSILHIAKLFDKVIVGKTPQTLYVEPDPLYKNAWSEFYYNNFYTHKPDNLGNARRRVLQKGVETECDVIFFCDFDRLLYWWLMYPNELKVHIANLPKDKFVVFGRTKAAMDTHPWLQRETEKICNELIYRSFPAHIKHAYDFIDYLAACRSIPLQDAKTIIKRSIAANPACIDDEWPKLVWYGDYNAVNGLGYESALFGIERPWQEEMQVRIRNLSELAEWLTK